MEENGMKAKLEIELIKDENPIELETKNNSADELISLTLPTRTRSNKRKHIRTDFDEIKVSSDAAEAQRRERERLERLSKIYESEIGNLVEGQCKEKLNAGEHPYVKFEPVSKCLKTSSLRDVKPSTSFMDGDVIELSSDEDSDTDCRPLGGRYRGRSYRGFHPYVNNGVPGRDLIQPLPLRRRSPLYRVLHEDVTDELHRVERERLCKKLLTEEELESKKLMGGRLLVNPGKASNEPDVYVPFHLNDVLQPHQLGGIRFMYGNIIESVKDYAKSPGFGCILAHAMGLGKTIQIIAFTDVFVRTTSAKKILIIVPVNTIQNWYSEFEKWLPKVTEAGENIRPFVVWLLGDAVKTNEQRAELLQNWHIEGGVLLIGYDMFRLLVQIKPKKRVAGRPSKKAEEIVDLEKEELDAIALCAAREALLDPGPDLVVCDEGHRIKNERTGIAAALSAIKTRRRIVLTGYPLQNNLMEYYCMVDFVRPHYLGSKKEFSVMFEKPIKNGLCIDSTPSDLKIARQRTHILVELLKGFVQRRTHHLLKNILPPSYEFVVLLRKSPIQRMLYRAFLQYAQNEINVSGTAVFNPLKAFAVCSKIWNHPDILYEVFQKRKIECESEISERNAQLAATEAVTNDLTDSTLSLALIDSSTLPTVLSDPTTLQSSLDSFNYDSKSFFDEKFSADDLDTILQDAGSVCLAAEETSQIASFSANDNTTTIHPAANGTSYKMGVRSKHATIANALLEELNLDKGIKYDWATFALHEYKPGILENGYKMVVSLTIIEQAVMSGEKVLLFSQSLLTLNQIERFLETSSCITVGNEKLRWKKNINYYRFDGSTTATEREKLITRFNQDPNVFLFLISTRAGSLGINLVSASRVIIFDASWNPCHDAQAVCRIYRYGQKRRTYVYRLITDNSMERAIFSRQVGKSGLQQRVVDDKQMDIDITKRELEQLLVYDEALDVATEDWNVTTWQIDDALLWMTALSHSKMFAQIPFLHESLMMEREDRLSEEEKLEARMLYEREKQIYKNGDFDYDWTLRGVGRNNEFESLRMPFPRMWSSTSQHGPMPLRSTPMAMVLERTVVNSHNQDPSQEATASSEDHPNGHAIQIISEIEMELPCLTSPGRKGKVALHERCWLVTLPSGVFIRSLRGDVYDARGTAYDKPTYKAGKEQNSFAPSEVIDLCDSDD
ncbi:unnamed protein product [Cercopithifilaria johnstoni]|uniref:Uncharacterized protein n=1 Tax=Cercopithifilaria johnstoni TaxID=2874296 RepID=A0A8J2M1R3_9BILA|nr:unnamed protein product [Cercopithifilaria johnstoni]